MLLLNDSQAASLRERSLDVLESFGVLMPARSVYKWVKYATNINVHIRNARFRRKGVEDGLPLQPPRLIDYVSGMYDVEAFYCIGKEGVANIQKNLARNGLALERFGSVLDFGCGCGRILRHMAQFKNVRFHGTDYNPLLIKWCRENLPFAQFNVNELAGRLPYEDGQFDFVYALSVFTHLPEKEQFFWLDELRRVVKPGGYCYFTVNGTFDFRTPKQREAFDRGEIVVQHASVPGAGTCHTYHPEAYLRKHFSNGFDVVDFIPQGQVDTARQDVLLLRKR
jgi:ubiquinone/menaquinone biosynthesis C-methylase UbiE